jgi:deazaflavin-dependent oxidoreductase (nitroreductase family)
MGHTLIGTISRLTRPLAGHRWFRLWAIIRHRGRKSGRAYETPVAIRRIGDGFVVAMVFGDRTQWANNILEAGSCEIRWDGRDFRLTDPRVVDMDAVASAFAAPQRWLIERFGVTQFLRLSVA